MERAVETGCQCLQVFTRNINRWDVTPIDAADAEAFRQAVATAGLSLVVAHDSYLINPAAADPVLRKKSIDGLVVDALAQHQGHQRCRARIAEEAGKMQHTAGRHGLEAMLR